jgi:hypothetical protein
MDLTVTLSIRIVCYYCEYPFLSVTLCVIMLFLVMLSVVVFSVIMVSFVKLIVVMLIVMAPQG